METLYTLPISANFRRAAPAPEATVPTIHHRHLNAANQPLSTPWLPVEIWVLVISQLVNSEDFPTTWINCRQVSYAFKRATELAFLSEALPQIEVNLSLLGCSGRGPFEVARLHVQDFSEEGERIHCKAVAGYRRPFTEASLDTNQHAEDGATSLATYQDNGPDYNTIFGNPPLLIEWTSRIHISVCRGPTSYYQWEDEHQRQLRCTWFRAGVTRTFNMHLYHKRREVSFLWKPLLNSFFRSLDPLPKG
ncbi:hypothetical protein BX600DRAFT_233684 [Xylariales sp. PMI_506]|nr:hypothetical protein BX600DRAFT_233684 [Xylariales sp. PMI_506]